MSIGEDENGMCSCVSILYVCLFGWLLSFWGLSLYSPRPRQKFNVASPCKHQKKYSSERALRR